MSEDKPENWLIALYIAFTNVSFKNNKYNASTIIDVSNENSIDCLSLKYNITVNKNDLDNLLFKFRLGHK